MTGRGNLREKSKFEIANQFHQHSSIHEKFKVNDDVRLNGRDHPSDKADQDTSLQTKGKRNLFSTNCKSTTGRHKI